MSVADYFDTMDYGPAPEADGDARAWIAKHDANFGHFIDGKFVQGSTTFDSHAPDRKSVV